MKIAVTSTGPDLGSQVDPRFGRCAYFLFIDTDTMGREAIENPNLGLGGGVGIQSAQLMGEKGVQAVLTGNRGPNAYHALSAAGIQIIVGVNGSVREAVEHFKNGVFSGATGPTVQSHFGMGQQVSPGITQKGRPFAPQMGPGQATGGGKGLGMGRGAGRGMGRGKGRRFAMGQGMGAGFPDVGAQTPSQGPIGMPTKERGKTGKEQEIEALKAQARAMEEQLKTIQDRISALKSVTKISNLVAAVDSDLCTACGTCQEVCPTGAISIDEISHINREICTGCGTCVSECPENALSLKKP